MKVSLFKESSLVYVDVKKNNHQQTFTSLPPIYKIEKVNHIKKVLPIVAFAGSVLGALGYSIGALGLFYDNYKETGHIFTPKHKKTKEEGVKTITTSTKFGKIGLQSGKAACSATAVAGVACGLGEGIPLMALGDSTNLASSRILETPVGTGLFGIGIASIFAGLALDNTPELKLNEYEVMAEKSLAKKAKIYLVNIKETAKEIGSSIFQIGKNIFNPKFLKDNIVQGTPKTVVFSESVNKDGVISVSRMLRHNKNYVMHAASFTLAAGGLGIIISSLLGAKKAEKASLKVEEGGFLFDNLGITRYGMDKVTTGQKPSGLSFAIGGVVNAISQFVGLDNKDGRALQWLGIAGVFLGYSIDRGKHLKDTMKLAKERPEITRVIREWKIDLSKICKDKTELKKLQSEIKKGQTITNENFVKIEKGINDLLSGNYKDVESAKTKIKELLPQDAAENLIKTENPLGFEKTKNILEICSEKIFNTKNPKLVSVKNGN